MRWYQRKAVQAVAAALLGAIGFAGAWSVWHLWQDHQTLHILVQIENQRRMALPAPPAGS